MAEMDMASCPKCYRPVPDGSLNCPGCLSRVVEIPPVVEVRHIDYLLGELSVWPVRRLVSSEVAHHIYDEYIRRRGEVLQKTEADVKPAPAAVDMAPQLKQRLATVASPGGSASMVHGAPA